MKLIEADKVKRVMKDYWKAQVDKALTLTEGNEANKRINSYIEHNHELLKAIDGLPSAEPDTTTCDSIPAKTDKNDGDGTSGDCISRRQAIDTLRKMQTYKLFSGDDMILIDKAEAQTELMMLQSAQLERLKGKWIHQSKFGRIECDQCGKVFRNSFAPKNFCPNCGADMRGEQE